MPDDNGDLQAAITFAQQLLGKLRALSAAHVGDPMFFAAESQTAAITLDLVCRQNQSTPPPYNRADELFYS